MNRLSTSEDSQGRADATGKVASESVRRVRVEISTSAVLPVLAILGGLWLLVHLWPILIVVIVALILVGTLNPAVVALERRRLGRTSAVALVFLATIVGVALAGLLTLPALWREFNLLVQNAPQIQSELANLLFQNRLTAQLGDAVGRFKIEHLLMGDATAPLGYPTLVFELVSYVGTSIVLALYLVADRDRTRGALFAVVPRAFHVRLARVLLNLETIVGGYMRGQLITSAAVSVFVYVLLRVCHVRGALAFAVLAGLTDVIPFVGGLLATVPACLAALTSGLGVAAVVCAALVLYQEFENRILVPRLYGNALRLPPAAVILALLVGGKLLGIIGALLALPVAAGLRMLVEELRVDMPGDDSDNRLLRESDRRSEMAYARRTAGALPEEAAAVATEIAELAQSSSQGQTATEQALR